MRFETKLYRHRGITILQKRDPELTRIRRSKVALVLAGGAISGGAFKIGGLRALDEAFSCRRGPSGTAALSLTDFDLFVGLSAGSIVASVLSAGIGPDEMLRILLGSSSSYGKFTLRDYMSPNWREPFARLVALIGREQEIFTNYLSGATDPERVAPYALRQTLRKMAATLPSVLPSGLFSADRLTAYLKRNMRRVGFPDDFGAAYARFGRELYLTAVDINRGQLVVFGHDEPYGAVPISEAITASCALPGWYRPVRVANPRFGEPGEPPFFDFADGALMRTANVRVAVEKGADLVICYNPFNRIRYERRGKSLVDHGPYAVASQLFRIVLGARLDLAKELLYFDDSIDADIVFIEPAEDDYAFFRMNPLDYWTKERAADHGYQSIRAAIQANHERLAGVFATHGIELRAAELGRAIVGPDAELGEGDLRESRGAGRGGLARYGRKSVYKRW